MALHCCTLVLSIDVWENRAMAAPSLGIVFSIPGVVAGVVWFCLVHLLPDECIVHSQKACLKNCLLGCFVCCTCNCILNNKEFEFEFEFEFEHETYLSR